MAPAKQSKASTPSRAISRHFESQDPVRYGLERLRVELNPKEQHPREWNAFSIAVSLVDHKRVGVKGLPSQRGVVKRVGTLKNGRYIVA